MLAGVLADRHEAGVVRVTIGTREHPGAVRSRGGCLVLDLLHWPDEVRPAPRPDPPTTALSHGREGRLMSRLVAAMSRPLPEVLAGQHDAHRRALQELADARAGAAALPPVPGAPPGTGVVQLVDALNASLARTRPPGGG